ncbi:DNA/RNA non-specific endonuclease [Cryomorphaceae bacterium 1068]|nr:DNA/RNA non-specific endonuclease [Cryomorphaceae bacterium 1068]
MKIFLMLTSLILWLSPFAQEGIEEKIKYFESSISNKQAEITELRAKVDSLKLLDITEKLEAMGWPSEDGELVVHNAFALSYSEEHEMASWVAHIILDDVADGRTTRTNDFRIDEMVSTGSSEEADYFLKTKKADGEWDYDGYGFDRGHLAPSADFRWNQQALSESYFYSNMTPQHPDFNRGAWAQLESYIRDYAIENKVDLYIVTGPVLNEHLPKVERSVNGMSLPTHHYKVALDMKNGKTIGFLMPNEACEKPIEAYALSINEIEETTGLNFFSGLPDEVEEEMENNSDYIAWLPSEQRGDVAVIPPNKLGKGRYNTLQAYEFIDTKKKVEVCGTVVSTFKSKNNNVFVNLDKKFPNTVFTLTIWTRNQANFSYAPENEFMGKKVCVKGEVTRRDGVMQMNLINEKQVVFPGEGF